jgi:hypothetical protein
MTNHIVVAPRWGPTLIAIITGAAALLMFGTAANAAIVRTVLLGTSANYAVLGASTVTNTGNSTLDGSLGLWPGTDVTGFPPGHVLPPGTIDKTNAAAQQAQSDLTAAYINAAGRPVDTTTTADLANKDLGAGVYSGPSKSPLSLTGPLVLNGAGDPSSVFIFQTDSTLITGSGSTVTLINGAQECNVFWQVGSSATLGTGSVFTGNILALTSITVTTSVTVHGRALARNGAVTLDNDTFTRPSCNTTVNGRGRPPTPGGTGTTTGGGGVGTTGASGGGGTTGAGGGTANPGGGTSTPGGGISTPGGGSSTPAGGRAAPHAPPTTRTRLTSGGPGVPGVVGPPRTGGAPLPSRSFPWVLALLASVAMAGTAGVALDFLVRVRRAPLLDR